MYDASNNSSSSSSSSSNNGSDIQIQFHREKIRHDDNYILMLLLILWQSD